MNKNFALTVLLSAVALLGFSSLQVIRSRSEVFSDIADYLSTLSDGVFQVHPEWPEEMKTDLDEIVAGLNKWKDTNAADNSPLDQPSFLLHR